MSLPPPPRPIPPTPDGLGIPETGRVLRFPTVRVVLTDGGTLTPATRRRLTHDDTPELRRRCRVQAQVAQTSIEAAHNLGEDAAIDGHTEAVKKLRLAALRFAQAKRALRLAEREMV